MKTEYDKEFLKWMKESNSTYQKFIQKVINRGGKSTGRNKYYVNVINDKQKLGYGS